MDDRGMPTAQQLRDELARKRYRKSYGRALSGTIWTLIVVAAVSVVVSSFFLAVLKTQGSSMEPMLEDGEFVVAVRTDAFERGDLIAFYYNNKILLKRVIGFPGDSVDVDEKGNVYVNGSLIEEPYVHDKCLGDGDVKFPYRVPDGRWFVLGDRRATSTDSRYSIIGTVSHEQNIGRVVMIFWPLSKAEIIH